MRFGRPKPPPYRPPRDRTPTAEIPEVGVVRQVAPRTAPIPLPATYPDALPLELEPVAELFTLAAQGRVGPTAVVSLMSASLWSGGRAPHYPAVMQALRYLARWESHYAALLEAPCPPGMRCPEVGLCPWHRKILRQWFDRLHPIVRAAAEPSSFEATVAPLLTDLPRSAP